MAMVMSIRKGVVTQDTGKEIVLSMHNGRAVKISFRELEFD